jgi:hypothetical protein
LKRSLYFSSSAKSSSVGDVDLIADKDFGTGTLPASSTRGAEHETAGRVDIKTGDNTCTGRARDDKEGNSGVLECTGVTEVVETKDIMGGADFISKRETNSGEG